MSKNQKGSLIFYGVMAGIVIIRLIGILNINIVSGQSMEPNYYNGELVLSSNLPKLHRGSIVVAKSPNERLVIKRLIAVPGDTVEFLDGKLYLNGELTEEDYIKKEECDSDNLSYTLSDDEYFISGDNRCNSLDSRKYGPLNKKNILASVITKVFSKKNG